MVTYGNTLGKRVVAGAVALSLVMPPAKDVFGQERRLAVNTPVTQTVVPSTVQFGSLRLPVETFDRGYAETDRLSRPYRTTRVGQHRAGDNWRDAEGGLQSFNHPAPEARYYSNMMVIPGIGTNALRVFFSYNKTTREAHLGMAYTEREGTISDPLPAERGNGYDVSRFSNDYRTVTGRDMFRAVMFVENGTQNNREYYTAIVVPADEAGRPIRLTQDGVTGYPAVTMTFNVDADRRGGDFGRGVSYIFIRD